VIVIRHLTIGVNLIIIFCKMQFSCRDRRDRRGNRAWGRFAWANAEFFIYCFYWNITAL